MGRLNLEERFLSKIKKVGNCWLWQGFLYHGYGKFKIDNKLVAAHRFSYEMYVDKIPKGLQIDHLCRNRACVNSDHLEAVTGTENKRRSPLWFGNRTHCKLGHKLSFIYGQRQCITCRRESDRLSHQRRRREKRLAYAFTT